MSLFRTRIPLYGLAFVAISMSLAASLHAHSMARKAAEPTAVATIDWLAATESLDEWKAMRDDLQKRKDAVQAEAESRATKQEESRQQLELLGPGTTVFDQTRTELQLMAVQNQAWLEFMEQALQKRELEAQIDVYNKISDAITAVAERDGWDIVLWDDSESKRPDIANLQRSMEQVSRRYVLYANRPVIDITDDVVRYMNNNYKSGG